MQEIEKSQWRNHNNCCKQNPSMDAKISESDDIWGDMGYLHSLKEYPPRCLLVTEGKILNLY